MTDTKESIRARNIAEHCEMKKDGYKELQDGICKLTLSVQKGDVPKNVLMANHGQRFMVVFVALNDDETAKDNREFEQQKKPEKKEPTHTATAGRLCRDAAFQKFLDVECEEDAKLAVYTHCGITSRKELNGGGLPLASWLRLLNQYNRSSHNQNNQSYYQENER